MFLRSGFEYKMAEPPQVHEHFHSTLSPPIFGDSSTESFPTFLALFETVANINGWKLDTLKLRLAACLRDTPLQYYLTLKADDRWNDFTFKQVTDKLKDLILPPTSGQAAEIKVSRLCQSPNQRPTQYFMQKLHMINELCPTLSDEKKIYYILTGLNSDILKQITV